MAMQAYVMEFLVIVVLELEELLVLQVHSFVTFWNSFDRSILYVEVNCQEKNVEQEVDPSLCLQEEVVE